jgi:hypothetical protein
VHGERRRWQVPCRRALVWRTGVARRCTVWREDVLGGERARAVRQFAAPHELRAALERAHVARACDGDRRGIARCMASQAMMSVIPNRPTPCRPRILRRTLSLALATYDGTCGSLAAARHEVHRDPCARRLHARQAAGRLGMTRCMPRRRVRRLATSHTSVCSVLGGARSVGFRHGTQPSSSPPTRWTRLSRSPSAPLPAGSEEGAEGRRRDSPFRPKSNDGGDVAGATPRRLCSEGVVHPSSSVLLWYAALVRRELVVRSEVGGVLLRSRCAQPPRRERSHPSTRKTALTG